MVAQAIAQVAVVAVAWDVQVHVQVGASTIVVMVAVLLVQGLV